MCSYTYLLHKAWQQGFPSVLWRCWLGDRKCIWLVKHWFVGGDDLTGALHVLWLQLSPLLPSPLAPIKPANPGSPGKTAVKTDGEKAWQEAAMVQWLRWTTPSKPGSPGRTHSTHQSPHHTLPSVPPGICTGPKSTARPQCWCATTRLPSRRNGTEMFCNFLLHEEHSTDNFGSAHL